MNSALRFIYFVVMTGALEIPPRHGAKIAFERSCSIFQQMLRAIVTTDLNHLRLPVCLKIRSFAPSLPVASNVV